MPESQMEQRLQPEDRLLFIDHLRMALIALVVLHHIAVIYAANINFYYVEVPDYAHNPGAIGVTVVLAFFQLFNQAFFMGLFFFLSGYFTPQVFDRKGPGTYMKDRLIRLGIPILVYFFVLNPLATTATYYHMPVSVTHLTGPFVWSEHFAVGVMWFAVLLLIFCAVYLLCRAATKNRVKAGGVKPVPKFGKILIFIIILAIASFLIRIPIPIAKYVAFFPSLGYLPQYASFFALGIVANRNDWLRAIPDKLGKTGLLIALLSIILFLIGISARIGSGSAFLGGGTPQSFIYALFDSFFSVGWSLFLITFFRKHWNRKTVFGPRLRQSSFAVYIIHIPVIVYVAVLLQNLAINPFAKFGLVAIIGVPVCFAAAYLLRRIPGVDRVL